MAKPKIRIFHNLGRSGGTLICKCLGCMEHIVLLSEIHPLGTTYYNPLEQAHYWHNIYAPQDAQFNFVEAIKYIETKCSNLSKNLVIRDWSYFDFMGEPVNQNPSYRMLLVETLSHDFQLIQFGVVRHPIDMWLSLRRDQNICRRLSLNIFIHGYLEYAKQISRIGFVKFEDFTKNPAKCMQVICDKMQLPYDGNFITKFLNYKTITGDPLNSRGGSLKTITPLPRFPIEEDLLHEFESNNEYGESLHLLNYDDISK